MTTLTIAPSSADHIQGALNAPVVLVQYGDFECPYCKRAYPVIKAIQAKYGDKLAFVFRNFPLTQLHQYAEIAAEASEGASENGKFWEYHDAIYASEYQLNTDLIVDVASKLGFDMDTFDKNVNARKYQPIVEAQQQGGVASGVHQTPSFFINGKFFSGVWEDQAQFLGAIDDALNA